MSSLTLYSNKLYKSLSEWRPTKITCETPNNYIVAWFWHFKQQYETKIQSFLASGELSLDLNKKYTIKLYSLSTPGGKTLQQG